MPVTLRPYRDTDADPTWRVFHTAVRVTAAADYTPEQLEAWSPDEVNLEAWGRRRAAAWTLVAVDGDRVVGLSDLTDDGVLDMMFVHPDAGGRGVGRQLVEAVLGEARRRGLTRVATHASRTARPAFERLGFVIDRENPDNWTRGVRVPNFDMHLDLPAEPG